MSADTLLITFSGGLFLLVAATFLYVGFFTKPNDDYPTTSDSPEVQLRKLIKLYPRRCRREVRWDGAVTWIIRDPGTGVTFTMTESRGGGPCLISQR